MWNSLIRAVDVYELILRYLLHNWGNTTRQQWQALKPHNTAILPFMNVEYHLSHAWQLHLLYTPSESGTFEDIIIRESGTDNFGKIELNVQSWCIRKLHKNSIEAISTGEGSWKGDQANNGFINSYMCTVNTVLAMLNIILLVREFKISTSVPILTYIMI